MFFLKILSVFLGTVIGAGIFGLPFVASKSGFFIVILYFLLMSVFVSAIHIIYGRVCLGSDKMYRLPGYAGEYLGNKWKIIAFLAVIVGLTGVLLAYTIIGGEFLGSLFSSFLGGTPFIYSLVFVFLGSYLVFRGIRTVSKIELFLFFALLAIVFIFYIYSFQHIKIDNFLHFDNKFLFFPYGVVMFSLWGLALVPELKEMLVSVNPTKYSDNKETEAVFKRIIISGIIISSLIYIFFIFIVLGVSGVDTSEEALSGLESFLGRGILKIGYLFGFITCFTSFIAVALTLKKTLWYDFGFPKIFSWFAACFLPLILYLFGMRRFINVISFTGALAFGLEALIVIFLYRSFLQKKGNKFNPIFYFLAVVFILGVFLEIFTFFIAEI